MKVRATVAGIAVATVLGLLIFFGSRNLRYFDAALIGYAAGTIFLAFGVTYRYAVWASSPPARRFLIRGWQAFLSFRNFRRMPAAVPRSLLAYLGFQRFIGARSRSRWIAHQLIFWGVVMATLITFPLSFGWFAFLSDTAAGPEYTIQLFGVRTISFDSLSVFGWLLFHGLDIAAVLVIAGCGYFLWRRFRRREATTGQRFAYDFVPLLALVAISVDRAAADVLELAAGGPRLRVPGRPAHGGGRPHADVHPVREVLPRHPAAGERGGGGLQARGDRKATACTTAGAAGSRSTRGPSSPT